MAAKSALSHPRPGLRLAEYVSEQAAAGDGRVLIRDRERAGEAAPETGNEGISLPDIELHLLEVAEKMRADEVGRAAARRIRLGLVARPDDHTAAAFSAGVNAHVD